MAGEEKKESTSELVNHIAENSSEVAVNFDLTFENPENARLFKGAAGSILAGKLARRIILATKSGVPEEEVLSAIRRGFDDTAEVSEEPTAK